LKRKPRRQHLLQLCRKKRAEPIRVSTKKGGREERTYVDRKERKKEK